MLRNFWNDQNGFLVSAELVLVATILVIGLIIGLVELQSAVIYELNDVACAIGSLNQSYVYAGTTTTKNNHVMSTTGSTFTDKVDECDDCQCVSLFCAPAKTEAVHP